jgi:hypothetical protein
VQLCIVLAAAPVRSPAAGPQIIRTFTRHAFDVRFDPRDEGQTATYFARWATKRGLTSPWSRGVSMRIV